MAQTYTHDPSRHVATIGAHVMQGFADGAMVMIARNTDQTTLKVGVLGDGTRSISRDRSARITVTLFPGSPTNDVLSALANADRASGSGTAPFFYKDLNGNTVAHAEKVWVVKMPDVDSQKESTDRVWILETAELEYNVGGELVA